MKKILLFGGGLQSLTFARSLKESCYYICVAAKHDKIVAHSNFIDEYIDIEEDKDPSKVIEIISQITQTRSISVVIPMEDSQAESLSRCKKELEKTGVMCAVMEWDVFRWVSDKTSFMCFCRENGYPHPLTINLNSRNIEKASDYVGFPALIKPSHSEGAKGISLVKNIQELTEKIKDIESQYGECSLQEYINKKNYYYNVMLYRGLDGSWGNYCVIKILRYYPIGGGSSSLCVTVENDNLLKLCKSVLEKINWRGFADFDILEKEDGDYRIIEINPRVPASLRAAAISGINFPEQIVSDILYKNFKKYNYKTGQYLRYLGLDIAWFLSSPNRFRCSPSWFKFFGKNIFYQEGGIRDLPAMCYSMIEGIKKQLNPKFRKEKKGLNSD